MLPDFNSLAGLPLTILPEPQAARTEIAIPPCALSRLHSSPDPPDPVRKMQEMQQHTIRQGFCYEGVAVAALVPPSPTLRPHPVPIPICRTRVWISTSTSTSLWSSGMRLRKMKRHIRIRSSSATSRPRIFCPRCCARRLPMATQTGPCSAL
ncbi:hypothetical protein EDB84DRAFT_970739 [Lactarius hengduanensis]|nr:hypothetical protein EDB84DRAFT_970739 [Lactarius hengduanensis]